jgi:muconolactone D-isomerase
MEFLVHLTTAMPSGMPKREWDEILAAEHESATKLVESGTIKSIWRVPGGGWKNVGIWEAADATELHEALSSLPLYPWMTADVTALGIHPLMRASV